MRILPLIMALCILFVACNNEAESNAGRDTTDESYPGYVKAYESDGIIILRREDTSAVAFAGGGRRIPDAATDRMIREHRSADSTWYVNFDLDSIVNYLGHFYGPPYNTPAYDRKEFGLRVYFAQDTGSRKKTVILSPTYKGRAMWRRGWSRDKMPSDFVEPDEEAMNQGSICPVCVTDDDELQPPPPAP